LAWSVEGGNSGNCPTQTPVDACEMKAIGKLWNEEGNDYAEMPFYRHLGLVFCAVF
jgi:hypothetical protein